MMSWPTSAALLGKGNAHFWCISWLFALVGAGSSYRTGGLFLAVLKTQCKNRNWRPCFGDVDGKGNRSLCSTMLTKLNLCSNIWFIFQTWLSYTQSQVMFYVYAKSSEASCIVLISLSDHVVYHTFSHGAIDLMNCHFEAWSTAQGKSYVIISWNCILTLKELGYSLLWVIIMCFVQWVEQEVIRIKTSNWGVSC